MIRSSPQVVSHERASHRAGGRQTHVVKLERLEASQAESRVSPPSDTAGVIDLVAQQLQATDGRISVGAPSAVCTVPLALTSMSGVGIFVGGDG